MPDPDRVEPMMLLVRILSDRQEWAEAESLGQSAVAIARSREGAGFISMRALLGLGQLHLVMLDTAGALPFLRSGVAMAEQFLRPDSPDLREARRNLAEAERTVLRPRLPTQ